MPVLTARGEPLPPPSADFGRSGWLHAARFGPVAALRLDDGRVVMVRPHRRAPVAGLIT